MARFEYEYSWELNFAFLPSKHPDRLHFTDVRSVEELMRDMSLDHQEAAEVTNEDTMNAQVTPQKRKTMDLTEATEGGASTSPQPSQAAIGRFHPF